MNKAIENADNVCMKCLKDTEVTKIVVGPLGYGSCGFDMTQTIIQLCNDCLSKTNPDWWKLEIIELDKESFGISGLSKYKYEKEIVSFVNTLPIEGKELYHNRFDVYSSLKMAPQDWIDYHLDILSHQKSKEYGLYSPEEKKAYAERFSVCKHVTINIEKSGLRNSSCHCGASGDTDRFGNVKISRNISDECYHCSQFSTFNALYDGSILGFDEKTLMDVKTFKEICASGKFKENSFARPIKNGKISWNLIFYPYNCNEIPDDVDKLWLYIENDSVSYVI